MSGRHQFPPQGGRPRSGNTSTAGYPREDRDSGRAYDHNHRSQPAPEAWADDEPYLPTAPEKLAQTEP